MLFLMGFRLPINIMSALEKHLSTGYLEVRLSLIRMLSIKIVKEATAWD